MANPCCVSKMVLMALLVAAMGIHAGVTSNGNSTSPVGVGAFLDPQNMARAEVGVAPLVWEPRLAEFARGYARQRRTDCALMHSEGPLGENMFWGSGRNWDITDIVAAWVTQKQYYDHNLNVCNGPDCTHYTQIVWRNTERVGCAKIICDSGDTLAVCEYSPPGNYINSRPY
ncbi:hypothetical protein AMTRI_Chr08g161410 [Amborella trichopoda]|nr:pathogenesis-related protein PR-1-like [Amborella trichopoda]|eukprot:XP_020524111.1 pathogenesis-related protein PR-1-like [Amborella trichopoda]